MKDLTCPVQLVMTCGHIKEGQSVARCPVQWHCTVALYSGIVQWHCTVEGVWVCLVTFTASPVLGGSDLFWSDYRHLYRQDQALSSAIRDRSSYQYSDEADDAFMIVSNY